MQYKKVQCSKYMSVEEIWLTPNEAIELIERLAAGVRAVSLQDWNNYSSGLFQDTTNEFRQVRFKVAKEA